MQRIKIIVGSYGYRPEGSGSVTLITKHHPPIVVNDAEAERLTDLGVAKIIENNVSLIAPGSNPDADTKPLYSMKNKSDELKALMDEFGLKYEDGVTKQQMVDALDEFFEDFDGNESGQTLDLKADHTVVE